MATDTCSLHCGRFTGVDKAVFDRYSQDLEKLFGLVEYHEDSQSLDVCGARGVSDMPRDLTKVFDSLSRLPDQAGRGRIIINCNGVFEVCYFRHKMWKLEAVAMPPDPFDGMHSAA